MQLTEKEIEFFDEVFQRSVSDLLHQQMSYNGATIVDDPAYAEELAQSAVEIAEASLLKRQAFFKLMEEQNANPPQG